MILTLEVLGILTMCTIMFVSIWGFIIMKQMLSQLKYRNYLVEKLTQYMHFLTKKNDVSQTKTDNNKKE
ncbi:hypothetical protein D9O40_18525 [Clostridium autoethanogenum]|uniref:Uncharacterized protein n=3 Tax=Clostridium TaxID=1485 RepID=D8GTB7_CLOLD|nr:MULTISPECIES: hypothetical protein [Clostridium]ADK16716.1 conserved hypothetical protein [Clostridium ljungdahlii DSM 13528]OAA89408.1 hypothetical protein WX45_01225 [Clostridium ljungdahlii DSM 13528]RMC93056.1 hypothetical protein D9O40_18525 [Clostridium autoethanogenum]